MTVSRDAVRLTMSYVRRSFPVSFRTASEDIMQLYGISFGTSSIDILQMYGILCGTASVAIVALIRHRSCKLDLLTICPVLLQSH